jgi:signal transduction histidine kinase
VASPARVPTPRTCDRCAALAHALIFVFFALNVAGVNPAGASQPSTGVPLRTVGVIEVDSEVLQFDTRQLEHWRIPVSRAPDTAELLFRQPSLWETHRSAVAIALSIGAVEGALISALLLQRRRWRRAELRVRALAGRLITAAETERAMIARDLHDGACQEISCLAADVSYLRDRTPALNRPMSQTQTLLQSIERRALAIAESLRQLSHELHPAALQHVGLVGALHAHCAEVERQYGLRVTLESDGDVEVANPAPALALFRVVQEALRNIGRHAEARHVVVSMARGGSHLSLAISDDGRGFDSSSAAARGGLGLVSMNERVRLVNGEFSISSRPQGGTIVAVRIPVTVIDEFEPEGARDELERDAAEGIA